MRRRKPKPKPDRRYRSRRSVAGLIQWDPPLRWHGPAYGYTCPVCFAVWEIGPPACKGPCCSQECWDYAQARRGKTPGVHPRGPRRLPDNAAYLADVPEPTAAERLTIAHAAAHAAADFDSPVVAAADEIVERYRDLIRAAKDKAGRLDVGYTEPPSQAAIFDRVPARTMTAGRIARTYHLPQRTA
jgi:hypothetical protein